MLFSPYIAVQFKLMTDTANAVLAQTPNYAETTLKD